ncbi:MULTISPECIES: Yip1 family protein [Shimia]|uniref:Yip1 family protein n=1 Tax=Shimia TaxID=573139 RepID=UPI001FB53FCD|nr:MULTISPECIES: Yip1 family protein [Shimia]MDV4144218.1 Yip1 family protein [Shimia sp. FJ5]
MMDFAKNLFRETIFDPAGAGRRIVALDIAPNTGWMLLGLATVLNTLLFFAMSAMFPAPNAMPFVFLSVPWRVALTMFVAVAMSVVALYWSGRILDGKARFGDILAMIAWLQIMRVAVQVVTIVLSLVAPFIGALLAFGAGIYGIWILIQFVNVAQAYASIGKAVMNVILTMVALVMMLSLTLSFLGVAVTGVN